MVLGRDRLGIKPLYLAEVDGALRFASTLPALLAGGGGIDTEIDPVALHHYLSFHSVVPAPLTILRGVRKLAAGDAADRRARRRRAASVATGRPTSRGRGRARPSGRRLGGGCAGGAAHRGAAADGRRRSRRRAALRRPRLEPDRRAARRGGPARAATFSIGFDDAGGERGDEFDYSDLVAARVRHRRTTASQSTPPRLLPAIDCAIAAMSEPMISPRLRRVSTCSARRSRGTSRSCSRARAPTRSSPATRGIRRSPTRPGAAPTSTSRSSSTARTPSPARWCDPRLRLACRSLARARRAPLRHARARARRSIAALRLDSEVMLVDDPVKRVDNMTMAWGLEARTPFLDHELVELAAALPAGAEARPRRQGHPQAHARAGCSRTRSSTARRATSRFRRCRTSTATCWRWCATR